MHPAAFIVLVPGTSHWHGCHCAAGEHHVDHGADDVVLSGAAQSAALQPPADRRLIVQVLRTEFPFQVLFFSRYDDGMDQRYRPDECSH
jgi:hypothetical protein